MKPAIAPTPHEVVILTDPVVPAPTTAVICVAEFTVKELALVPPNFTDVAPVKFEPVITTDVPVPALAGVNPVICGITIVAVTAVRLDDTQPVVVFRAST